MPVPEATHGPSIALVVLAAGDGNRAGHDTNKVLLPLAGRRVFTWGIRWGRELAHELGRVTHTVLVIRPQDRDIVLRTLEREVEGPEVVIVDGGDSRHGSEWRALCNLAPAIEAGEIDIVVIHDAARPLAGTSLFADVVAVAARDGGAVPVLEQHGLTPLEPGPQAERDAGSMVVSVQTPQAFMARPLLEAYARADGDGFVGTDTASCMERYTSITVSGVPGDARNIKITYPEDLFLAERLLARAGYDLTQRAADRPHLELHLPHLRLRRAHS